MELSLMIKHMTNSGVNERYIARLVGVSSPTINKIKSGANQNPSYKIGKNIEYLYFSFCHKSHAVDFMNSFSNNLAHSPGV